MRKLDFATYKDKVMGCWAGKNIGGVLGAPFEGKRQVNDISFYTQDLSMGPPPNDDLDLQIIWLAAVERYGRNVNASILESTGSLTVFPTGWNTERERRICAQGCSRLCQG